MPTFYGAVDLGKNELRNAVVQNIGSAPSTPSKGQIWFDSTNNILKWYDGGTWVSAMGGAGAVPGDTVSTQAIGDAAAPGASTLYSRADHKHAMPAFGTITGETSYGLASSNGSAATIARSDHTHGSPSLTSATPSTQAIGDTAAAGTGTLPAREDHKHAMPSFGAVVAETAFGSASGNGAAATLARSDHVHGNPVHDAAAHSTIPLSALAVPTANINMNGKYVQNVLDPVASNDAATKNYVDLTAQGLDAKNSVKAATAGINVPALSGTGTFDGVALVAGDRLLVKDQTTPRDNGIYVLAAGPWSRATDMDSWAEVPGAFVFVEQGTVNADSGWVCTADQGGTLGTTNITWTQFSGAGQILAGNGLTKTGNTIDFVTGDTTLTVAADSVVVNTGVIATVASLSSYALNARNLIAGTGLTGGGTLAADRTFAVDFTTAVATNTTIPRKYTNTITGTVAYATGEVITHNLNTQAIQVSVLNTSSPNQAVEVDWEATTVNSVTLRYNPNLGAGYRVVVVG